jgi:hypothetical protein
MTVIEFLEYLLRGKDTNQLAHDLAWVYGSRQAAAQRQASR